MAWDARGDLWVVNTLFSCLATLHGDYSFVPRWQPPFITGLAGEDRCHLNGLAMDAGQPRFVTVMSETNEPASWRPHKGSTGCILDVASGAAVTRGLAMPHSPRWKHDELWVLNSGYGSLETVDLANGRRQTVATMPGYTRGLAFCGSFAFIGLSRIRESAVFGGVPIAEHRDQLKCGVGVVNWRTGQPVASLEFETGVEEIFDVQVVPDSRCTAICGPRPDQDSAQDIWIVPRLDQVERMVSVARQPVRSPADGSQDEARAASDADVQQWVAGALALQRERRMPECIELLERAAAARPQSAEVWNHLGNALQDAGRQEQALDCYRRAAAADPHFGPGLQNLGYVLVAQGFTDEGVKWLTEAQRVQPADVNHVLIATALPVIYESADDLRTRRRRLLAEVQRRADNGLTIDTTNTLVPTNFFAAYQGDNDRDLHANLGRIYRGLDLCGGTTTGKSTPAPPRKSNAKRRPRIGFLSAYFRDHTIGRLNIGRVEHLPRERFEMVVLSVGDHRDPLAERFRRAADRHVIVPRDVAAARRLLHEQKCDLLFFADVGMDALTYTLAFSRMAPIQVATWGHPVTTGSPAMDYFLSSELLEAAEGDGHYTERLVRLPSLGTYYERPQLTGAPKSRQDFGCADSDRLYICPQTLFKMHPDFDALLGEILRRDSHGKLALIEGRTANWTRQLQARLARTIPDVASRIHWLPALPNADFLQLLAAADVMLDPLHFGGGNTSYEAFAVGLPVVTLPGPYLRSRITQALYRKMASQATRNALDAVVASSAETYADLACELAAEGPTRARTRKWLAEQSSILFEDAAEVEDLAMFLQSVTRPAS
jgi:predicted O-linked N-acetylglucosamine transferase (SPINDLY family)